MYACMRFIGAGVQMCSITQTSTDATDHWHSSAHSDQNHGYQNLVDGMMTNRSNYHGDVYAMHLCISTHAYMPLHRPICTCQCTLTPTYPLLALIFPLSCPHAHANTIYIAVYTCVCNCICPCILLHTYTPFVGGFVVGVAVAGADVPIVEDICCNPSYSSCTGAATSAMTITTLHHCSSCDCLCVTSVRQVTSKSANLNRMPWLPEHGHWYDD